MADNYDGWEQDDMNNWGPPPPRGPMNNFSESGDFRNKHYREAYGDYNGGYTPAGFRNGPRFSPYDMPEPPFNMGRGYGPLGPPGLMRPRMNIHDGAKKFLIRCGMIHEQIKHIPKPLLEMIHPYSCGLCCIDLDSFLMAKLHYQSKNHLKNQKKWIAKFNGETRMGSHNAREIPIKSRDLYCELCDVHITSKVHAESHYAGKSHRSVVDGRKPPKNRFLMQSGMEGRLEQLIRREKRNLKASDAAAEVDEVEFKDIKHQVPPELICNICETTVTNSEQMTMHLNGKRHLAKEKQHILRMMRGAEEQVEPMGESQEQSAYPAEDEDAAAEEALPPAETDVKKEEIDKSTEEWQNGGGEEW